MKQTVLMHRALAVDPSVITSETVLEAAMLGGAKFTGFDVGVLAPGRLADVIVTDVTGPSCLPHQKTATTVVNSVTGANVQTVVVDGRVVVEDARCVTVDEQEVIEDADRAVANLGDRVGLARFAASWAGG